LRLTGLLVADADADDLRLPFSKGLRPIFIKKERKLQKTQLRDGATATSTQTCLGGYTSTGSRAGSREERGKKSYRKRLALEGNNKTCNSPKSDLLPDVIKDMGSRVLLKILVPE
jgi:hypothetical protein